MFSLSIKIPTIKKIDGAISAKYLLYIPMNTVIKNIRTIIDVIFMSFKKMELKKFQTKIDSK